MIKRADLQLKKQPIVIGEVKESNKDRLAKLQLLQKEELINNGNTDYAKDLKLSIKRLSYASLAISQRIANYMKNKAELRKMMEEAIKNTAELQKKS